MPLPDTKIKALKPRSKAYQEADEAGLFIEVSPTGQKTWRLRYRMGGRGAKQEKVTLGEFPTYGLGEARTWREDSKSLATRGISPMALKRGDPVPVDIPPASKELAARYLSNWCQKAVAKVREQEAKLEHENSVSVFAWRWFEEIAEPSNSDPRNVRRVLEKDVIPAIGAKQVSEVTVEDILAITDSIKARGADQMALQTRNILKRLFAYAIARQKTRFNPAAAIEGRFIAQARSRDVALTAEEVGRLLRGIYQSSMKRAHKLALHLLILCMVRKTELVHARWEELDLDKAAWHIPMERMKKDRPHFVPLSRQATAMFEELKSLSCGSEWVFPSRNTLKQPISQSTLNVAVRALELDVRDFVIHDFRRTASTLLHEAGFHSDWIEKSLAHEQKGIRGVYNKAQYAEQRRDMLQWWADFVDSQIDEGRKVIIGRFGKTYQAA